MFRGLGDGGGDYSLLSDVPSSLTVLSQVQGDEELDFFDEGLSNKLIEYGCEYQ